MGGHQAGVAGLEPRELGQGVPGEPLVGEEPGLEGVPRVAQGTARLGDGQGRQPEVQVAVEPWLRKAVDGLGQPQGAVVPPGEFRLVAGPGQPLQEAAARPVGAAVRGLDLEPAVAPQGAEQDTEGRGQVLEVDRGLGMAVALDPLGQAGDDPVPEGAKLLFHGLRPPGAGPHRAATRAFSASVPAVR